MSCDDTTPRLAFVGDESLVVQCAAVARAAGHPVVVVASRSEGVRRTAAEDAFHTLDPAELPSFLAAEKVDVLFSIANEFVVPDAILEQVAVGVNFHDGPLPDYAGLAVTTWALFNGETMHAVTWHEMTAEVDRGGIVLTQWFEITPDETAFSLNARCYQEAIETFPRVLGLVTGQDRPSAHQPDRSGSWYSRYRRPIVFIDPSKRAVDLNRAVRSVALGPRIRNRVGVARCIVGDQVMVIDSSEVLPSAGEPVGAISVTEQGTRIATVDGDLLVSGVMNPAGAACSVTQLMSDGLARIPPPDAELVAALTRSDERLARHETFWSSRLARFESTRPSHLQATPTGGWNDLQVEVPEDAEPADIVTGVAVWWCRTSGAARCWFDYSDDEIESTMRSLAPLVQRPIGELELDRQCDWTSASAAAADELADLVERGPFLRDLIVRTPWLRQRVVEAPLHVHVGTDGRCPDPVPTTLLQAVVSPSGGGLLLRLSESIDQTVARRCAEQIGTVLSSARYQPSSRIEDLDLIGARERVLLHAPNRTALTFDRSETIDAAFRRQVGLTPEAAAVSCAGASLTYTQLAAAVNVMAQRLHESGASAGTLVGIALDRDIDMLVAVLAVLTIGAAYVPLDPAYPHDRLAFMVADSGLSIVIADHLAAEVVAGAGVTVVAPIGHPAGTPPFFHPGHGADDLAYVIYTSGSTGRPKGVMLEHRNVVNFFAAMDEVIDHDPPGTWLAVTSLSFDISVLELLWTITRGFHVVIQKHGITSPVVPVAARGADARPAATSLSLFFFAAGEEVASGGYRLLRESAKFADVHDFEAIWLPERHFHPFGGAYPNPSVLGAAVAALTERVAIRAGSIVLPLHSSARVAEEWAVVDNLSAGRVGVSFAPGWQPNDFVLNPAGYRTAREDLPSRIEEVRALWRGESVEMSGPDERVVSVQTLPRPVQPELPVWLTSAGTTTTFEQAGTMGLNLLTHLLGQSIDQLKENIQVYRTAWRQAGRPGEGRITVMLHTFLDTDSTRAKRLAEQPMKQYLGAATGLLKNLASAFPTFANSGASADEAFRSLTDAEMDELLAVATARYLDTSGLFGSLEDATAMALGLSSAGVDEIACLVDFGIDTDHVLNSLPLLADLKATLDRTPSGQADDASTDDGGNSMESLADLVARHDVTHLQCTPSLAAMLIADPRDRDALESDRPSHGGRRSVAGTARGRTARVGDGSVHEHVRPDRDDDLVAGARDRRTATRADSHRAADRQHLDPHPRSLRATGPHRSSGRAAHRRRRSRPRIPRTWRADFATIRRPTRLGTPLRDGRPGPDARRWSRRVRRASRLPGEDPGTSNRTRRDRDPARSPPECRTIGRRGPTQRGRHTADRLRGAGAGCRPRRAATPPTRRFGPARCDGSCRHRAHSITPADTQRQSRSSGSADRRRSSGCGGSP